MSRRTGTGTSEATLVGLGILSTGTNPTVRLVYATAVQFMNARTLELAPGHRRIAGLVGCSERTVERSLKFLVGNGLLRQVRRGNRHRPTIYEVGPTVQARLKRESTAS